MTTALILGAAVWRDGPSPALVRRTNHGAALFHAGSATGFVVCGGLGRHSPTEAEMMARLLCDAGVPDDRIQLEDQSTTTGENITFAQPFLRDPRVLIVTDWYHGPRAKLIARRLGLTATVSSPSLAGAKIWPQAKGALREIAAYCAYALRLKS